MEIKTSFADGAQFEVEFDILGSQKKKNRGNLTTLINFMDCAAAPSG